MITPGFLYNCINKLPVTVLSLPRTCVQRSAISLSLLKRVGYSTQGSEMSDKRWKAEKERILSLSVDEKRKLYRSPGFVTPNSVPPWSHYAIHHDILDHLATPDDEVEFRKISIDKQLNETLAEKVAIFKGDITKLEVDAIVNAANCHLRAGGGVDGAIHREAGPLLQEECFGLVGCPTGEAKVTCGYNLPAKYVIQTVGPQDQSVPKLHSCYVNCLGLLPQYKIKTIAFPCISTGVYGFPNRRAAHIALATARKTLEEDAKDRKMIQKIIFCTFMPVDVEIYETLMKMYFPVKL